MGATVCVESARWENGRLSISTKPKELIKNKRKIPITLKQDEIRQLILSVNGTDLWNFFVLITSKEGHLCQFVNICQFQNNYDSLLFLHGIWQVTVLHCLNLKGSKYHSHVSSCNPAFTNWILCNFYKTIRLAFTRTLNYWKKVIILFFYLEYYEAGKYLNISYIQNF